ncbi:MAG TPA: glucoamylase family protein [Candidatus Acidoferrum sp.]|jgi:hypothetical protein|nr:glucoamylase family protein [Candidatus Acidoferrum sp.]
MTKWIASAVTRREMLRCLGILAAAGCTGCRPLRGSGSQRKFSSADDQFLEDLERTTFRFFDECSHPQTGLVKDRSRADGNDDREIASIAATGFGLTALCIADQRGWLSHQRARERALLTLRFLHDSLPHEHGFFFHFVNWRTGDRLWACELSSIDTALLLAGVLTCRAYFDDAEIRSLAQSLYDRVDWRWMAHGSLLLRMGWKPEMGFLDSSWRAYSEHMVLYLMAIGANEHALAPESWRAWRRPWIEYDGNRYVSGAAPLFIHQFSHAWFDFRGVHDGFLDYFKNSVTATRAHRQFCRDLHDEFPQFGQDLWGITSSDSAHGYVGWGGPPRQGPLDGTLVPCAAAGSLPFLPAECLRCLQTMRTRFGDQAWRRYGFVDAFNPVKGWFNPDVIGIDAGITLLMAENLRTGFVWRVFMRNPEVRRGMKLAGFVADGAGDGNRTHV